MTLPFMIRVEILRELMKDPEYAQKLRNAKEWHEIFEVIRQFTIKKGYKFAEVYIPKRD